MPDQTPIDARTVLSDQLAMVQSTIDDAHASALLSGAIYTEFTKRIAFIMFARVFDAHVSSIREAIERMNETRFPGASDALAEINAARGLADQVKASFKAVARVNGALPAPDFGRSGWEAVRAALDVRHRLVHPKSTADLAIDENEVLLMRVAIEWLDAAFRIAPAP